MMHEDWTDDEIAALIHKLSTYGRARDRATEREPRTITISDDEALMILSVFADVVRQGTTIEGMTN